MRDEDIIAGLDAPLGAARPSVDFDVLNEHIGFAVHRAFLALLREFSHQLGPIRPIALNALVLVGANPGITQSQLVTALMLDKGTGAHLLSDLEKQGWIERRTCLNDRRGKGVYLTPAGVQEATRLKAEVRKLTDRFHALYTPDEYRQLFGMLNRIVTASQRGRVRATHPASFRAPAG
jgi:DNA-binding MarR family transcriptional regulator